MRKLTVQLIDITLITLMNIFFLHLPIPIAIISSLIIFLGIYSFRVYDTQTMKSYTESLIKTTVGTLISFILILILYFFLSKYFNRYFFLSNLLFTIITLPILHKIEYKIYVKKKHTTYNNKESLFTYISLVVVNNKLEGRRV